MVADFIILMSFNMGYDGRVWQANEKRVDRGENIELGVKGSGCRGKAEGAELVYLLDEAFVVAVDVGEW